MSVFPVSAERVDIEVVRVAGPGFSFEVCAHGARELAERLIAAAEQCYCDGYRHGDEGTMFIQSLDTPKGSR